MHNNDFTFIAHEWINITTPGCN